MVGENVFIGEGTLIRKDVKIGNGSKIWHYCNIYGCKIGENTQVGSYSEIKKNAVLGDNCRLQSYIFIPEGTQIGNYVFIGPRVTFLNDKNPTARKAISGKWELEKIIIEDEVSIGGGVTILPGIKVGRGAMIGAGSNVTKDVPAHAVIYGNPAKITGNTKKENGYNEGLGIK
jgi:acetyltransferase-like isoleucine patch superfamily enzyme